MLDGCGRNIRYARISVTDLCNLGCLYCKPRPVPKLRHEDLLSVDEIVALAYDLVSAGFEKIRITGGEPLVRKGIIPIVKGVSGALKNVGMTTNGTLLAGYAEELKKAGLKGVNVSLDTVDPRVYREVSGGDLNDVLKGISAASEVGMKIKINAVLQRGVNDDPLPLADLAASAGAELRMIELMPFASTLKYVGERSLRADEWLTALGAEYKGSDGKTDFYSYRGRDFGVIAPLSRGFCAECDRIRITCTGTLLPCLHRGDGYPLREKIGKADFKEYLSEILQKKPVSHGMNEGIYQKIDMGSIGG